MMITGVTQHCAHGTAEAPPQGRPCLGQFSVRRRGLKRRGATAMEYLVCLTFIIVVVIVTVQHIGGIIRGLLSNSPNAITNK